MIKLLQGTNTYNILRNMYLGYTIILVNQARLIKTVPCLNVFALFQRGVFQNYKSPPYPSHPC